MHKMKTIRTILILIIVFVNSCNRIDKNNNELKPSSAVNIIFLHHSTGQNIWDGGSSNSSLLSRAIRKLERVLGVNTNRKSYVQKLFIKENRKSHKDYRIEELNFPKESPYGWNNYPYDYYNIWIRNEGIVPYMGEPTLEILIRNYDVIVFKHCFPVSNIQADKDTNDINSDYKSLSNYKLQYLALRDKLHQFPDKKFVVWTGAAQVKSQIQVEEAVRAREFFQWVLDTWDQPHDNIFVWDFYQLQTEGGYYFLEKNARSTEDSHPNDDFSRYAAKLFFNRLLDIIENNGLNTDKTGKAIYVWK
jgi:hypothetical protein